MSEVNTEAEAESTLLAAVMGPDEQDVSQPGLDPPQNMDDGEEDETETEGEAEPEKAAKTETEAPEEDEVEIPGEEGQEPKRYKLADLVQKAQEYERLEGQKAQIIDRAEREVVERASGQLQQIEHASKQTAYMIQGALQMLQPPQPPNTDMLNPASQSYNPDQYHMQFAHYQRAAQQYGQAQQLGQQLLQQAQAADAQARETRERAELQRLNRVWPEFGQTETTNKFVSDMEREYGFTAQELDDVLVDHRQALVARDALAFRAMKAQSGNVKAKLEAKAPKLVRSKQEAKGTAMTNRDTKGKFTSGALAELKKTNSDEAAAAFFTGLVKQGRI